jgi:hypothetical protein
MSTSCAKYSVATTTQLAPTTTSREPFNIVMRRAIDSSSPGESKLLAARLHDSGRRPGPERFTRAAAARSTPDSRWVR